jgi:hypothetical protein
MPFAFIGEEIGVGFIEEDDVLVGNVGVNRNLVAGEIVIDEEAGPLVDHQPFHQRRADPHGHRSDHLATCGFGIEDPTRSAARRT